MISAQPPDSSETDPGSRGPKEVQEVQKGISNGTMEVEKEVQVKIAQ